MYRVIYIFFFLFILLASATVAQKIYTKGSNLKVGSAEYSLQDYKDEYSLKERFKFRVLKPFFKRYFLTTNDSAFLKSLDTGAHYYCIEPLIINLTSRDGFYTYRDYPKKNYDSPRFLSGFPHWPFLISGGKIFFFNSDTIKTKKIIDSCRPYLLTLFKPDDIDFIKKWAIYHPIWAEMVALAPHLIYNKRKVYWDENK